MLLSRTIPVRQIIIVGIFPTFFPKIQRSFIAKVGYPITIEITQTEILIIISKLKIPLNNPSLYKQLINSSERFADFYESLINFYERARDFYESLTDFYERVRDLYERLTDLYERVRDSYESLTDLYERLTDLYERVRNSYEWLVDTKDKLGLSEKVNLVAIFGRSRLKAGW